MKKYIIRLIRKVFGIYKKNIIVVWFSCGAASAVAAKKTIEKYGKYHKVIIVNNPIKEEHKDNRRFLKDIEKWIGQKIIIATASKYPNHSIIEVFEDRKYMSGIHGAPCTLELKKQARYEFELKYDIAFHVLGFTYEEKKRFDRFTKFERGNVIPILIDEKISKPMCFDIIIDNKIKLPLIYKLGFPNANCIGCVKSSSPTYWNLVRKHFPKVFEKMCKISRKIGCKLVKVKGKRIYLDELKVTDKGGKIKSWECGIFCDIEKY